MKTALTIAGSDSGGGAGIQADLKSFQANGVFGMSVLTALTAQNSHSVTAVEEVSLSMVRAQLDAIFSDMPVHAIKTGMLASTNMITEVSSYLAAHAHAPLVVDPVMVSKSGFSLIQDDAVDTIVSKLFPLATLITPNAHEAERLLGRPLRNRTDAIEAAQALCELGPRAALVKGGHLDDEALAVDVLFDGSSVHVFEASRVDTPHTHGTGCTTASAIAANLAKGFDLVSAVERAKVYVHGAITHGLALGKGHGPTHHFWYLESAPPFPYGGESE